MIWLLLACTGELLPSEAVLGDQVRAVVISGTAGSGFGGAVAVGEDHNGAVRVLVGAPDSGSVQAYDSDGGLMWSVQGESGLGTRVGWHEGAAWAWAPGQDVVFDIQDNIDSEREVVASTASTVCPDGQVQVRVGKGEDIACDVAGVLTSRCEGADCTIERPGSVVDGARTSAGSAVGFWGDLACFGDAEIARDAPKGSVQCEDGTEIVGESGDHLGLAIAGGRVAGVFNRHLRPPRARIPSLDGEVTWVVDRAAEHSRIALAGAHGLYVVGVPGFGAQQAREGRVYVIEDSQ
jgi:hypothetical protein